METEYIDDLKNGKSITYFSNGNTKSIALYKDDTLHGEKIIFYPNGRMAEKILFKNGLPNGEFSTYYFNGKIAKRGNYRNGRVTGKYVEYFNNGTSVVSTESYILHVQGEEVLFYRKKYDSLGNLLNEVKSIELTAPDSIEAGGNLNVLLNIPSNFNYDSAFIVTQCFDEDFNLQSKCDTIKVENSEAKLTFSTETEGDFYIRGALIMYSNIAVGDTIHESSEYRFFEKPISVYKQN